MSAAPHRVPKKGPDRTPNGPPIAAPDEAAVGVPGTTSNPAAPAGAGRTGAGPKGAAPRRDGRKVYARRRGGGTYYYGDFRPYADVGGRQEALVPPGRRVATQDFAEAARLYAAREAVYRRARADRARGVAAAAPTPPRLGPFLRDHLEWKAGRPHVRDGTIDRDESSAKVLLRVLGNVSLGEVTPARLEDYVAQRLSEPGIRRGSTTAARTVRAELHCLSHAMRRAVVLGHVAQNPVRLMMSKPALPAAEAAFLADAEAARLLEAAREEDAGTAALVLERREGALERARGRDGDGGPAEGVSAAATSRVAARAPGDGWQAPSMEDQVPFAHAVVATYLYTGGRADEVLGLLVGDVDLARARVHFRHNRWRRLKREHHQRAVQLWPALAEALRPHLDYLAALGPGALEPEALLFPSPKTGRPLDRFGKPLDRVLRRAGLVPPGTPRVTPHTLRHTFATALLQTLVPTADGGWAVRSSFDVAKQLGHRSSKLVDDTYGHAVTDPVYRRDLRYGGVPAALAVADPTTGDHDRAAPRVAPPTPEHRHLSTPVADVYFPRA